MPLIHQALDQAQALDLGGGVTLDSIWWAGAVALAINLARTVIGVLTGSLRK